MTKEEIHKILMKLGFTESVKYISYNKDEFYVIMNYVIQQVKIGKTESFEEKTITVEFDDKIDELFKNRILYYQELATESIDLIMNPYKSKIFTDFMAGELRY